MILDNEWKIKNKKVTVQGDSRPGTPLPIRYKFESLVKYDVVLELC